MFLFLSKTGSTPKGKKLLPVGAASSVRVDPFSEGDLYAAKQTGSHIKCHSCKNGRNPPCALISIYDAKTLINFS